MQISLEEFDISVYEAQDISLLTPRGLKSKLLSMIDSLTEQPESGSELYFEEKIRAVIDCLVIEGLRQKASIRAENRKAVKFQLPKLSELDFTVHKDISLLKLQHRIIILAPNLKSSTHAQTLLNLLSDLMDTSSAATEWIIDLSLIEKFPFELLGYLIGLKQTLEKKQVNLDLLWLREDAIPHSLYEVTSRNFNLHKRGAFLLSRTVADLVN